MKPHTTHHDDCGCLSEKHRAEIDALRARVAEVEKERDAILMQARSWASEAKTQRATVNEVGSALGGIPDWGPIVAAVNARLAALAASQAEVRSLREWVKARGHKSDCQVLAVLPSSTLRPGLLCTCEWRALLSRPHGDDTALREMLTEAVAVAKLEGMKGQQYVTGGYGVSESDLCSDESIVNRILGQPGDDAKEG